jgi:hypothetical protein
MLMDDFNFVSNQNNITSLLHEAEIKRYSLSEYLTTPLWYGTHDTVLIVV